MRRVSLRARRASLAGTLVVMALSAVDANPVRAAAVDPLGADVDIAGGDAVDRVDCTSGGVTPGNNRCEARADGGDVSLTNVDIYFKPGDTMQVNGGAVDLPTVGGGDATAGAACIDEDGRVVDPKRVSICIARAQGGAVRFRNVQVILHRLDGSTSTARRDLTALRARPARSTAVCTNRGKPDQQCDASAGGALVAMHNVAMFDHQTNTTRTNINISVRGGNASAFVICGIVGSGVSRCAATANGGNASLRDVRLHTYEIR